MNIAGNVLLSFSYGLFFLMRKLIFSEKCMINGTGLVNHNFTTKCIDPIQLILI
jgi:hypothetical protein